MGIFVCDVKKVRSILKVKLAKRVQTFSDVLIFACKGLNRKVENKCSEIREKLEETP